MTTTVGNLSDEKTKILGDDNQTLSNVFLEEKNLASILYENTDPDKYKELYFALYGFDL